MPRRRGDRGALQAARPRPTACRPTRSRSPWRSPTSSTRWSASGPSTRSRPAPRTPMRCAAPRSGVIRLVLENSCGSQTAACCRGWSAASRSCESRRRPRWARRRTLDLLAFFADRLKVHLREQGARHDLIDAVFALPQPGRPPAHRPPGRGPRAVPRHRGRREPARRLSPRRQHPPRRGEEGRRGAFAAAPIAALIAEPASSRRRRSPRPRPAGARPSGRGGGGFRRRDAGACRAERAVDAFFDKVTVNAEDPALRENRLRLLRDPRGDPDRGGFLADRRATWETARGGRGKGAGRVILHRSACALHTRVRAGDPRLRGVLLLRAVGGRSVGERVRCIGGASRVPASVCAQEAKATAKGRQWRARRPNGTTPKQGPGAAAATARCST